MIFCKNGCANEIYISSINLTLDITHLPQIVPDYLAFIYNGESILVSMNRSKYRDNKQIAQIR